MTLKSALGQSLTARQRLERALTDIEGVVGPKRSLGQNFLVSDNVIEKIVKAIKNTLPEVLIEIGPGPGALTDIVKEWTCSFSVIELDRSYAKYWREKGLNVLEGDALQMDWKAFTAKGSQGKKRVLMGNLPYQISSSLVIDRCLDDDSDGFQNMIFMFQKEVAERITSLKQKKSYGFLSVMAQVFWKTQIVCEAGTRDFWPAPKVASRVLLFERKLDVGVQRITFLKFVKTAFAQRRKLLKSNLAPFLKDHFKEAGSPKLMEWLSSKKYSDMVRAEELSPEDFKSLYLFLGF